MSAYQSAYVRMCGAQASFIITIITDNHFPQSFGAAACNLHPTTGKAAAGLR